MEIGIFPGHFWQVSDLIPALQDAEVTFRIWMDMG
jgi:hypothetical protein